MSYNLRPPSHWEDNHEKESPLGVNAKIVFDQIISLVIEAMIAQVSESGTCTKNSPLHDSLKDVFGFALVDTIEQMRSLDDFSTPDWVTWTEYCICIGSWMEAKHEEFIQILENNIVSNIDKDENPELYKVLFK